MSALEEMIKNLQASDKNEKGLSFELICLYFLKHDKLYSQIFSEVYLWRDWPDNEGSPDIGIDIVAKYRDKETYCAVQCKFRQKDIDIKKKELDSFLAASGKKKFTGRILFALTAEFSRNAASALKDQSIPVRILTLYDLENSSINWDEFNPADLSRVKYVVKTLFPHQVKAVDDVLKGFTEHDRGKLIMACGTGKTFTSLKIAENFTGKGGFILVLAPSISLLNQSLLAWNYDHDENLPLISFAVCSDITVGRKEYPEEDLKISDLVISPTTDAQNLFSAWRNLHDKENSLTVIFSTYQSLQVIHDAQSLGLPSFDLIICDEAHRTAGVSSEGKNASSFKLIHDDEFIRSRKRLYMTATPKIFSDNIQKKAKDENAPLYSMDDENIYGPVFHWLTFSQAVDKKLLTDYKVMIFMVEAGEDKSLDEYAILQGVCKALAKDISPEDYDFIEDDKLPMKRAVNFTGTIAQSKDFANIFPIYGKLKFEAKHIDGTNSASQRSSSIHWLAANSEPDECRILSNARCLSEGVDVPALDAVIFFSPKRSEIDIVQSVGRVMRRAPGKNVGYVILPVVITPGEIPELALDLNESYNNVWKVLQALRAHDDHFEAVINSLDLNMRNKKVRATGTGTHEEWFTHELAEKYRKEIYVRIVKKCGDREYWEKWIKELAQASENHSQILRNALSDEKVKLAFSEYLDGLRININRSVSEKDALEMLAQHIISRRVFDELFSSFSKLNPVSKAMQKVLATLSTQGIKEDTDKLEEFYAHVQLAVKEAKSDEAKQRLIRRIYENFFRRAFPETAEKLGIVYTPEEIVQFILKSSDWALRNELGISEGISADGVHVLDPFSGTGTFIVRLIQSGLISNDMLGHKYARELHANEILLLAYYISAINIEAAFHERNKGSYTDFSGMVLADTFKLNQGGTLPLDPIFYENSERAYFQERKDITVIIGNPPYKVGGTINDYAVDNRIKETYVKEGKAMNKVALYDSYIRAIRWATDRLKSDGVICFVTNASFIDGNAMDGMRKVLVKDFAAIYIYNFRGNANTMGEIRRQEGDGVFGDGSRLPVAITLFVKKENKTGEHGRIYYYECGDYMKRAEKLGEVSRLDNFGAMISAGLMREIVPNEYGDWLNPRSPEIEGFFNLGNKNEERPAIFDERYSRGVVSGHDAYSVNFSREELCRNMKAFMPEGFSEEGVRVTLYSPYVKEFLHFTHDTIMRVYQMPQIFPKPDTKNLLICISGIGGKKKFSALMVNCLPCLDIVEISQCFPLYWYEQTGGLFGTEGLRVERQDGISDFALRHFQVKYNDLSITKEEIFYYIYGVLSSPEYALRFGNDTKKLLARVPFVEGVRRFREFSEIGRELGALHVNYESVEAWPMVLRVNGERVDWQRGERVNGGLVDLRRGDELNGVRDSLRRGERVNGGVRPIVLEGDKSDLRISKMKIIERNGERIIRYNNGLNISGIPSLTWDYVVNGRSALGWIVERYDDRIDKASGIRNNCNEWGEAGYVLDLISRVVRVSVDTMKILRSMPELCV